MQVNVEVGRRAEALDQRDGAAVGFVGLEPSLAEQVPRDQAVNHACSTEVTSLGCAASSSRSGIGSDSTFWETAWRALMPEVQRVASGLAAANLLRVTRKGVPVDAMGPGGPIRLGRP